MARKRTPGLYLRKSTWHIDKKIQGTRLCESTGTCSLEEAEKFLAMRTEQIRQAVIFGIRPQRTFQEAAAKFLIEHQHKKSIADDANHLKLLVEFIGTLPLNQVHGGTLKSFIDHRLAQGRQHNTINLALAVVRRIVNLAAAEWIDEHGLTWLSHAPKIKFIPVTRVKKPYTLNWNEQKKFFAQLPAHLLAMATFSVNTGCRDQEVCGLRWDWECFIPELKTTLFVLPSEAAKNGQERIIILNTLAKEVIEKQRGQHDTFVFTYRNRRIHRIYNNGWKKAWKKAELPSDTTILRGIHNLRHTFGRRLRAAGVSEEDRKDLLGHKNKSITTHYSMAEIKDLISAANKICEERLASPVITRLFAASPRKSPASEIRAL